MYWTREEVTNKYIFKYSDGKDPISEADRNKIISDLAEGMPGMKVKDYFENQLEIFNKYEIVLCAIDKETNKYVGIFGSKWYENYDTPFLYLWTAFVAAQYQGSILFLEMAMRHIKDSMAESKDLKLIVTKTYHPTVYRTLEMFSKNAKLNLYPSIDIDNHEHLLAEDARKIANIVAPVAKLDEKTGALVDGMATAGIEFYSERPTCSVQAINEYFAAALNTYDQMLCIIKFDQEGSLNKCLELLNKMK
ncbi:hypothetical protein [Anaeromicropila populeti]|uniref:N-acetyltransferase domain-containing protein n=1 Tax=Anaeromicropila populeti TaxID=37658 RepID=A0A1I6L0R2_9FIRM|nr:hypothetical protein [Anaeromicropila populeti]SFR97044.1 hypothetical protein SAMN05661086_02962 [Anaeromicropila populeti]